MKLFSKEILILIFVLAGSLVIFLSSPQKTRDSGGSEISGKTSDNSEIPSLFGEQNGIPSLFKSAAEPLHLFENPPDIILGESEESRDSAAESFRLPPRDSVAAPIETPIPLSLEAILAQIENLSSDLKLEFENIQKQKENYSTCGKTEQDSSSVCAAILAQGGDSAGSGGAQECDCNNPEKCYRQYAYYTYWHCRPECCCVCCIMCCGRAN